MRTIPPPGPNSRPRRSAPPRAATRTSLSIGKNLAEEIQSLGKPLKYALASQIFRVVHHLVNLEYSPAVDSRKGWRRSIRQARTEIRRIPDDSPSLRREVARMIADETRPAIEYAIQDLRDFDELDCHQLPSLQKAAYTEQQALEDWFPEEQ
jgi:hypothetical protein